MQWAGCCGEEGYGGDRGYVRRCSGQGVVVRRDMEVTEVMLEDAVGCGCCGEERHGGDRG